MNDNIFEVIFGNEEKVRVIKYLLLREGEKVNSEEMRKFLKISKKSLMKKEIKNLAKIGFIEIHGKYLKVNSFFQFNEILKKFILSPSQQYKEKIVKYIYKTGTIKLLVFSGLLAGDNNFSDVDILIVGERINEKKLNNIIEEMEANLGKEINYLILSKKDFEYRYSMFDGLVRGIFERKNEILIGKINLNNLK
jgi:hypothetical protein